MIANAKAVAHGIRAMLYVSGESRNKKHPERITRICDNFMPQGMDATGIWTEMKFATMNHPNIKNNVIRMEISPAMEHTENFTVDDWRQLWNDFAAAFDSQEIRDKDGKTVSARTNISHSKSSVWLHEESKSGIPHLHAIVCRVDEDGNINNDHAIHLRAQRAAEKVARQRGWITAMCIHERNIPQVSTDCMEALRELDKWSWDGYKERLAAKGYELHLRKDKKDVIRGYVLCKGNTKFKASELGKGAQPDGIAHQANMGEAASRTGQTESQTSKPDTQADRHTDPETYRTQCRKAKATAHYTAKQSDIRGLHEL